MRAVSEKLPSSVGTVPRGRQVASIGGKGGTPACVPVLVITTTRVFVLKNMAWAHVRHMLPLSRPVDPVFLKGRCWLLVEARRSVQKVLSVMLGPGGPWLT